VWMAASRDRLAQDDSHVLQAFPPLPLPADGRGELRQRYHRFFLDNNASTNKHAATERDTRAEPGLPTAMKSLRQ
jgi:hypothetical protein